MNKNKEVGEATKETINIGIGFGALSPTISEQLKKQGFKYDEKEAKYFETLRVSITHLMFGDILPDSVLGKARVKLFNKIKQHVKKMNNL